MRISASLDVGRVLREIVDTTRALSVASVLAVASVPLTRIIKSDVLTLEFPVRVAVWS